MSKLIKVACCALVAVSFVAARASEPAGDTSKFRTDGGDESLPWYQIKSGVFPPEGSAHYFAGELVQIDHLERQFVIRLDRTDAQKRSQWDTHHGATMLPFGSVMYRGAPASVRDIPIGTHLHGWFYEKDATKKGGLENIWFGRRSMEARFTRCIRLEDDFSFHVRQGQLWRIDAVSDDRKTLDATLIENDKPVGKPQTFDLLPSTRVWRGQGFVDQKTLAEGQQVLFNLTWATLYGPGRLTDIWIDADSRVLATTQQRLRHQQHVRERGLPGWVDAVDNQKRIVTITFFGNVDPSLFDSVKKGSSAGIAVAKENLGSYDPVNDRKSGPVLEVVKVSVVPGSSGVRARIQPSLLLEGYRPGRVVRVYPSGWPVVALPREERWFGRD